MVFFLVPLAWIVGTSVAGATVAYTAKKAVEAKKEETAQIIVKQKQSETKDITSSSSVVDDALLTIREYKVPLIIAAAAVALILISKRK